MKDKIDTTQDHIGNGGIKGSIEISSEPDQPCNGKINESSGMINSEEDQLTNRRISFQDQYSMNNRSMPRINSGEDQFSNVKINGSIGRINSLAELSSSLISLEESIVAALISHPDTDGGWAWVVFVACFFTLAIVGGLLYTGSIFYAAMLQQFGQSYSYTAWMGSLNSAFFMLGGPVASWFIGEYGCRSGMFAGSLLMTSGYITSAFAQTLETVLVAYGIIVATGMCFAYSSVILVINEYFVSHHALATSFTMTGVGLGLFCYSQTLDWVAQNEGWQIAFLFCGATSLQICVLGAAFFPAPRLPDAYFTNKMAVNGPSDPLMQQDSPRSKMAANGVGSPGNKMVANDEDDPLMEPGRPRSKMAANGVGSPGNKMAANGEDDPLMEPGRPRSKMAANGVGSPGNKMAANGEDDPLMEPGSPRSKMAANGPSDPLMEQGDPRSKMAANDEDDPLMEQGDPRSNMTTGLTSDASMQLATTCKPERDSDSESCSVDLEENMGRNKDKSHELDSVKIAMNGCCSEERKPHQTEVVCDDGSAAGYDVPLSVNTDDTGGQKLLPSKEAKTHRGKHWLQDFLIRSGSYMHMSASAAYLSQCSSSPHRDSRGITATASRPRIEDNRLKSNAHSFCAFGLYDDLASKKVPRHPASPHQQQDIVYGTGDTRSSIISTENAHIRNFREKYNRRRSNPTRAGSLSSSRHTLNWQMMDGGRVSSTCCESFRPGYGGGPVGISKSSLKRNNTCDVTCSDECVGEGRKSSCSHGWEDRIGRVPDREETDELATFKIGDGYEEEEEDEYSERGPDTDSLYRRVVQWLRPGHDSLLLDPKVVTLCLATLLLQMGSLTFYVIYKDFYSSLGFHHYYSIGLSTVGAADLLGRITTGCLCSLECVNSTVLYGGAMLALSVVLLLHLLPLSYQVAILLSAGFGFLYGMTNVLLAVVSARVFGRQQLPRIFGFTLFWAGVGALVGAPIGGCLLDWTGSYSAVMLFTAATCAGAGLCVLTVCCYNTQHNTGHSTSYNTGHSTSYDTGHNTSYDTGHSTSYDTGHNTCYNTGHNNNTSYDTGGRAGNNTGHKTDDW